MLKLNGVELNFGEFPNGEMYLKTEGLLKMVFEHDVQLVTWKWNGDSDIFKLIVFKKHLDNMLCKNVNLSIAYLPYSRMDRTGNTFAFTLKYLCEIINGLNFRSVTVMDPHSDVSMALLDRSASWSVTSQLVKHVSDTYGEQNICLVFPDKGAERRYRSMYSDQIPALICQKTRDFATGQITGMSIEGGCPSSKSVAVIVDDLCCKGGTFMLAAERINQSLFSAHIKKIILIVAHCEKTILTGQILNDDSPISSVYTTNSIIDATIDNKKISVMQVF